MTSTGFNTLPAGGYDNAISGVVFTPASAPAVQVFYAYAMSFWYDAAQVILRAEPYALDFVRHRARQVARELANLLPLLEPDPEAPAAIRRRPPTIP